MSTYLIIGASRGIGLEICRNLHNRGEQVIATCRAPTPELSALGVRVIDRVDVAEAQGVQRLAEELADARLDVLLHNAGILSRESFAELDEAAFAAMQRQYLVNSIGPLRVVHALQNRVKDGGKIGLVSSRVGSIADNQSGGNYGYRASKTALNLIGVNLAHDLRARNIAVLLLHPGYVKTDMTGGGGNIAADESARGIVARMDELNIAGSGGFMHAEGYALPW